MISKELLQKKTDELEILASTVETCARQILQETPIHDNDSSYTRSQWGRIPDGLKALQRITLNQYQSWYTQAYLLIKEYLPEKEEEFKEYYHNYDCSGVLDHIQLNCYPNSRNRQQIIDRFDGGLNLQRSILFSVPSAMETKELSMRKVITADFVDSELEQAELLIKIHPRAAGSIAGVALEKHLKTQCELNGISYTKGTIKPLADALKTAGRLNSIELGQIEFLARVRNQCVHATEEEIPESQIRSFIDQVRRIVNS
jgi:hypothetical protein